MLCSLLDLCGTFEYKEAQNKLCRIWLCSCYYQLMPEYFSIIRHTLSQCHIWIGSSISCYSLIFSSLSLLFFPSIQSDIWPSSLWQLTDGCGRASQMVLSAAHTPPHRRHTDGSVHLPCFKPGGRRKTPSELAPRKALIHHRQSVMWSTHNCTMGIHGKS